MMTAPGPGAKVNIYNLLRQVLNQEEQEKFFHQHGFLPEIVECGKCKDNLSQVYPLNNPAAKSSTSSVSAAQGEIPCD